MPIKCYTRDAETEVVDTVLATPLELAWSDDEPDDYEVPPMPSPFRLFHSWRVTYGIAAAVVASCGVVAAVVAWPDGGTATTVPTPAASTAASTAAIAAPGPVLAPSTVTVTAAPPSTTVAAPPTAPVAVISRTPPPAKTPIIPIYGTPYTSDAANDQVFLASVQALGYGISNEQLVLRYAHQTCQLFQQGNSSGQVLDVLTAQVGNRSDAAVISGQATLSYWNCGTQTGS